MDVIKRLDQFVIDASMDWDQFKAAHDYHVLVLIPAKGEPEQSYSTSRYARPLTARPPIDDSYRVGVLKKRLGGHPFSQFVTIGRAPNNDIILQDIEVSKVHAFFERADDSWTVRDNESTNGTYHNGVRIPADQKTVLRSTDTLKIGPGVSAVFFGPNDFYQFLNSPEVQAAFK